jgi:hypothetical protein
MTFSELGFLSLVEEGVVVSSSKKKHTKTPNEG